MAQPYSIRCHCSQFIYRSPFNIQSSLDIERLNEPQDLPEAFLL